MSTATQLQELRVNKDIVLPDNDQWQFRMEIHSETSNRKYVVSQNKKHKYFGCSCPGWIRYKTCKHLRAMGLPTGMIPYEVTFKPE